MKNIRVILCMCIILLTACGTQAEQQPHQSLSDETDISSSVTTETESSLETPTTTTSSSSSTTTPTTTTTKQTTATTFPNTESSTFAETTSLPETVSKDTESTKSDVNAWSEEYRSFIKKNDTVRNGWFSLYDITGDDIPEIFIPEGYGHPFGVNVYTYDNDSIVAIEPDTIPDDIGSFGSWGTVQYSPEHGIMYTYNSTGGFDYEAYYKIENNKFYLIDNFASPYFEFDAEWYQPYYEVNLKEVTREVFERAYDKYSKVNDWISLGDNSELNMKFIINRDSVFWTEGDGASSNDDLNMYMSTDEIFDKIIEAGKYPV